MGEEEKNLKELGVVSNEEGEELKVLGDVDKEKLMLRKQLSSIGDKDIPVEKAKEINPKELVAYKSGVPIKFCKVIVSNNDMWTDNEETWKMMMNSRGRVCITFDEVMEISEETLNNLRGAVATLHYQKKGEKTMRTKKHKRFIVERQTEFYYKRKGA
jgi:hypothetical protein